MRTKSKKKTKRPASRAPRTAVGRKLATALKQLRKATERARKADPEFDRLYRRVKR